MPVPTDPQLSEGTKQLGADAARWRDKKEEFRLRRPANLAEQVTAKVRLQELLLEAGTNGDFSAEARRRAREASGLAKLEDEHEAIDTLLRGLPQIIEKAQAKFDKARRREAEAALETLDREWTTLIRKELVPRLRELGTFLPEAERIALLAKRWAEEGGVDLGRYRFPGVPIGGIGPLVKYLVWFYTPEIEGRR